MFDLEITIRKLLCFCFFFNFCYFIIYHLQLSFLIYLCRFLALLFFVAFGGWGSFFDLKIFIGILNILDNFLTFFYNLRQRSIVKLRLSFIKHIAFGLIFFIEIGNQNFKQGRFWLGLRSIDEAQIFHRNHLNEQSSVNFLLIKGIFPLEAIKGVFTAFLMEILPDKCSG